ncbi:RNA binding protein snu13 [Mucor velutinosus]|uniref:RNA binding protein snu13 n=1 Tax=Mucor velutinosus TaxID=708070 RepID=A0AAN7D9J2_9FUNG|nr:RNA binding protein snu13 [Mucor velutinosus]
MSLLPNELIQHIISLTEQAYLTPYLFVCKYTFHLARQRAYKKVIFPDKNIDETHVISFCELYGLSITTMKLPQARYFSDAVYDLILTLCPKLEFIQSNIYPKQLAQCIPKMRHATCVMATDIPEHLLLDEDLAIVSSAFKTTTFFPCCASFFIFPSELVPEKNPTLTQISHYFHHPGALSNAILPTFGSDLLALTLNPYDVLTSSVARLIVSKCPKLRYLVVPAVKAEGLWMLLRWCHTLAAIVVGSDSVSFDDGEDEEQDQIDNEFQHELGVTSGEPAQPFEHHHSNRSRRILTAIENERAVETVQHHKRVWCVHFHTDENEDSTIRRFSWHIGIIPKI